MKTEKWCFSRMTHCFQPDCVSCGSKMELRFANVREWCINLHAPYLFNAVSTCTLNHQKKWWVGDGEAADEGCKCSFFTLRNVSVLKTLCCGKTYSINFVFHWLRFYWMWNELHNNFDYTLCQSQQGKKWRKSVAWQSRPFFVNATLLQLKIFLLSLGK